MRKRILLFVVYAIAVLFTAVWVWLTLPFCVP